MELLFDSHLLLAIALRRLETVSPAAARTMVRSDSVVYASAASLWEIAIEARLGKLDPGTPLERLADFFEAISLVVLPVSAEHAVAHVEPLPTTRDPFDRLLLAQCEVEAMRLVTLDQALCEHPLALHLERTVIR